MKAYKGFDKDFCCRDLQYEIGKEQYQEGKIICCNNGLHSCINPLDVLKYYSQGRYAVVEASGEISEAVVDSKIASSKLKPIKEITRDKLIQESLKEAKIGDCLSSNGKIFALNLESFGFIKIGVIVDIVGNNYTILSLHEASNVNWYEARDWCKSYSILNISDWELPDTELLRKSEEVLKNRNSVKWYWTSTGDSYDRAWRFDCRYYACYLDWGRKDFQGGSGRVCFITTIPRPKLEEYVDR